MELNWKKYSALTSNDQNAIFQITKGELYIAVLTLNTENNNKLSRLLSEGFEKTAIWNEYKSKIEGINIPVNNNNFERTSLDTSFQGVSRLFAAAYKTDDIQNVNSSIARYNELLKMTTGRSEDYSTGFLLDYATSGSSRLRSKS